MDRLIVSASIAALLLLAAVFAGSLWLKNAEELPRHHRTSSDSPALVEVRAFHGILPEPTSSAARPPELWPIGRYSGRWLGAFETNLFQPENSADLFWLSGEDEEIWSLYKSRVTEPQRKALRRAAKLDIAPPTMLPNHLCIDTDLVGVLRPPRPGEAFGQFRVLEVLRADPIEVAEGECLDFSLMVPFRSNF